jgi:hypothetical protein
MAGVAPEVPEFPFAVLLVTVAAAGGLTAEEDSRLQPTKNSPANKPVRRTAVRRPEERQETENNTGVRNRTDDESQQHCGATFSFSRYARSKVSP